MRFMMIIKSDAKAEAGVLPDEKQLAEMGAFNDTLMKSGTLLAAEGVQASSKGARVRRAGPKTTIIDGPFAETKELVAGFWTIRANSKADAIELAKRVPLSDGEIELRQVYETDDFPVDPSEQSDGWREREERLREAHESGLQAQQPPRLAGTKRFIVFIKGDKNTESGALPNPKVIEKMGELMDETVKSGMMLGGDGLFPSALGARVISKAGKRTVIDGPFTEAKELIAGYSLIQAKGKSEAVAWGKRMLDIHVDYTDIDHGEVEVRQVFDLEDFPVDASEKPDGWRQREQQMRERLGQ